ncbi:MAG: alcohol dehydrogenase catalytic domain-containing protein, partial [Rhizobiaceae bacterium]|nr:alcohol dehydrogenase catalytic domain-containing protein [Rhizobiaceae bacterium]
MTTKAAVYRGDKTFSVDDVQVSAPDANDVQVKVAYCGICGTDLHIYLGHMDARVGFERTIGHEMSGVISAVGEGVSGLEIGQNVVVRPLDHCGDCPACDAGHEHVCHNLKFIVTTQLPQPDAFIDGPSDGSEVEDELIRRGFQGFQDVPTLFS